MPDRFRPLPLDITTPQPPKVVEDSSVDSVLPTPDKQTNTQELHELSFETWVTVEIPKQYEEQIEVYNKLGLLQLLIEKESGDMGIVGIDGREYPIPTLESIQSELRTNREKYETKQKQGFVKLQMTPFGLPLERLTTLLEERILDHGKRGKLLATKELPTDEDEKLELDTKQPLYKSDSWLPETQRGTDVTGDCVYHPTSFDKTNHGGLTKQQILDNQISFNSSFAGWEVKLLEATINIPREKKGKTVGGRKQLETNKSPKDYLQQLLTDPTYRSEQGLTNEDWLILFLTHLEQTNQVIDDWGGKDGKGGTCFLAGSYNKASDDLGCGSWDRINRQAYLRRYSPGSRYSRNGVRSAVGIGN